MTVPDFQSLMLPIVQLMGDGQEHSKSQYVDELAAQLGLSTNDQSQLLPSGTQTVFENRVAWAVTYLTKARLLKRTGRGRVRITDVGRQALDENPVRIDMHFLERYPEYRNFRDRSSNRADSQSRPDSEQDQTPDERLETSYRTLRQTLAQDLLERIKQAPPAFFEQVVVDLLIAMGYGGSRQDAGQAVGKSGDGGIDGIIKEDKLGLDFVYVQAKRWDETVGRPLVQAFAGSLEGRRARKGVFITTSAFTGEAQHYVTQIEKRIVLVDGEQLAQLMIDHGVGVADVATYHVKRIDSDYFDGE